MTGQSIEELRRQLRDLGYLTHGIERWFALDPWSSRAFWQELVLVALKAAILVAPFVAIPMLAVMLIRNDPMGALEAGALAAAYLGIAVLALLLLVILTALALKVQPAAGIDHPSLLTALSLFLALLAAGWTGLWWIGFDGDPEQLEWIAFPPLVLLLIVVGTVVFAAALLSFSIHESRRIPVVARTSKSAPLLIAGAAMLLLLVGATRLASDAHPMEAPRQIVARPAASSLALVAVDGLTRELLNARPALRESFAVTLPLAVPRHSSAAERWASVGTGTSRDLHGVRSVEGIRLAGSSRILQSVSRFDPLRAAPAHSLSLATRHPLPNTVREREYVWEILGQRGVPAAAVNWWVTPASSAGALRSVGQEAIFAGGSEGDPAERALAIDERAATTLLGILREQKPHFATVYLPALDIVINRLALSEERKLALGIEALDGIERLVSELRNQDFDVVLLGAPGRQQSGAGVLASTLPLGGEAEASDLAPTLLDQFGFPASAEMPGTSLLPGSRQERIPTFGSRSSARETGRARDQEYYDALRSLGYVQ